MTGYPTLGVKLIYFNNNDFHNDLEPSYVVRANGGGDGRNELVT